MSALDAPPRSLRYRIRPTDGSREREGCLHGAGVEFERLFVAGIRRLGEVELLGPCPGHPPSGAKVP